LKHTFKQTQSAQLNMHTITSTQAYKHKQRRAHNTSSLQRKSINKAGTLRKNVILK